jgi:hypothetical protein
MKIPPLQLALLGLVLCSPVRAQEIEYDKGLICETQEQAQTLVARLNGDDFDSAVRAVNAGEQDPQACRVATVAFVRGNTLATARTKTATFQLVRVLVLGVETAGGYRQVVPAAFVSVFRVKEYAV